MTSFRRKQKSGDRESHDLGERCQRRCEGGMNGELEEGGGHV